MQVVDHAKRDIIESIVFHADHINNQIYHHAQMAYTEKKKKKEKEEHKNEAPRTFKDRIASLGMLASPIKLSLINLFIAIIIILVITVLGGGSLADMSGSQMKALLDSL
jgi:hypothetical protein